MSTIAKKMNNELNPTRTNVEIGCAWVATISAEQIKNPVHFKS